MNERERVGQELAELVVEIVAEETRQRAAKKAMAEKLGGLYTRQTELADTLLHWDRGTQLTFVPPAPDGAAEVDVTAGVDGTLGVAPNAGHALWCEECGQTGRCFCLANVDGAHRCERCGKVTAVVIPDGGGVLEDADTPELAALAAAGRVAVAADDDGDPVDHEAPVA
jgi:hypothetical protein